MAERLLKCYGYCNTKHPKSEMIQISNKNYCIPCAEKKNKETEDRQKLHNLIKKTYNIPYPTGQMLAQIKQFTGEREYTLEGIYITFAYYIKVMKKKPIKTMGLSFVPYNYENALDFYKKQKERQENSKGQATEVKRITIAPHRLTTEYYKKRKMVDMGDVLSDG